MKFHLWWISPLGSGPQSPPTGTAGEFSLALAHRSVYDSILLEGLPCALVFENDVVLARGFAPRLRRLSLPAGLDVLKLENCVSRPRACALEYYSRHPRLLCRPVPALVLFARDAAQRQACAPADGAAGESSAAARGRSGRGGGRRGRLVLGGLSGQLRGRAAASRGAGAGVPALEQPRPEPCPTQDLTPCPTWHLTHHRVLPHHLRRRSGYGRTSCSSTTSARTTSCSTARSRRSGSRVRRSGELELRS